MSRDQQVDIDLWIVMGIIGAVIVLYLLTMRVFFRQSKEADTHIDYSKIRPVKDKDD